MTKYAIFWINTITGHKGNGTHAYENLSVLLDSIYFLNKEHPDIYHYYEIVSEDTPLVQTSNK